MSEQKQRGHIRSGATTDNDLPLNGPDVPFEEKQAQLEGRRPASEQGEGVFAGADVDDLGELTRTAIYQGELEAGVNEDLPNDDEHLELLTERELRDGETDNPFEAIEEGLTYVPPSDPPITPGGAGNLENASVASGMGNTSLDEPYDADHAQGFYTGGDDLSERVREALRADSSTTEYADKVRVITRGAVVVLRGQVEDLTDSDNLAAVASFVEGVDEVIDELRVRTLG